MIDIVNLTEEQVTGLVNEMDILRDRVGLRQISDGNVPSHFVFHQFGYRTSDVMILLTIDSSTSGRWAYSAQDSVLYFEDEADMTMFMLAYIEPKFKPARLV